LVFHVCILLLPKTLWAKKCLCLSRSHVLCFHRKKGYCNLLLAHPKNICSSKKEDVTCCWSPNIDITSPIWVTKTIQLYNNFLRESTKYHNARFWIPCKYLIYLFHSLPMWKSRVIEELNNNSYYYNQG